MSSFNKSNNFQFEQALQTGNYELTLKLYSLYRCDATTLSPLYSAIFGGNLDCVQFVLDKHLNFNLRQKMLETTFAVKQRKFEIFQLLLVRDFEVDAETLEECVIAGFNFMNLFFMYNLTIKANHCPNICDVARTSDRWLEKIVFLLKRGFMYSNKNNLESPYIEAMRTDKLDIFDFLLFKKVPLDLYCSYEAACKIDLTYIKMLLQNNCPIDKHTLYFAAKYNTVECLKLLMDSRFKKETFIYEGAIKNSNIETFKFLCESGFKLEPYLYDLVYNSYKLKEASEMIKCMKTAGCINNKNVVIEYINDLKKILICIKSGESFDEKKVLEYIVLNREKLYRKFDFITFFKFLYIERLTKINIRSFLENKLVNKEIKHSIFKEIIHS